mmetsp:Transcript_10657/g.25375  ORF Transcript_10657/g.25375 Transcript_10657/m.25375 type:complete len:570 (-) Transcript_10657:316-2025(-)
MLSRFSCGLAVIGWLGICLLPLSLAIEEGALWTASELAGDGVAGFNDGVGSAARFSFSAGLTAEATWLAGVAFTEDERSVVVVDTWNQAIRQVNVETRAVETLVQAQARDAVGSPQDYALSGVATFGTFVVFSNNWDEATTSQQDPRLEFYDTNFGGRSRVDTSSFPGGGPHGITMVSDNEMVFSQRNAGLWELNYDTREQTHKAGPEVMSDLITGKGWNDGAGKDAQMSEPVGLVATPDGQTVYFVDNSRCNVRRLNVATNEVTTIAGATSGTSTDGSCSHADGDSTTARFKNPVDCALLPNGDDLLVTDSSHTLRLINLATGDVSTLAGTPNEAGLRNGRGSTIQFSSPSGIAATADKIVITDTGNHIVRLLRKTCLPYYILVLGTCRACEVPLCPLGNFRAPCTETVVDAQCEPCPIVKPENSEYVEGVNDCSWACVATHQRTIDGAGCQLKPEEPESGGISDEAIVAIVAASCAFLLLLTAGVLYYIRDMDLSRFFGKKKPAVKEAIEMPKKEDEPQTPVQVAPPISEEEAAGVGPPPVPVDPMVAALNESGFDSSPMQHQAFGR